MPLGDIFRGLTTGINSHFKSIEEASLLEDQYQEQINSGTHSRSSISSHPGIGATASIQPDSGVFAWHKRPSGES